MNIIIILLFFLVYNFLYWILDFYYKKNKWQKEEIFRKIAHIWTGLITFFSLNYLNLFDYWIIFTLFLIEFIFIRKYDLVKFMTSNKRWYWDIYFILWQAILIWFMNYNILITKIWLIILTLADWLAPFWKKIFDKKLYKEKTFWWSIVFFLITFLFLLFYLWFNYKILIIALILTIVELLSYKWLDNILLPIFTILILYFYDKILYL